MLFVRFIVFALGCSSPVHPIPPPSVCVIERVEAGEVAERSTEQLDGEGRTLSITNERVPLPATASGAHFAHEYDAEGRLVAVEMTQGSIMTRREATYEAERVTVRYSERESTEFTLEDGRVVASRHQVGTEPAQATARYAYDAEGRLVEIEEHYIDVDTAEPVRRVVRVLSFDPAGRVTSAERATTYGTMPETVTRFDWSYEDLSDGVVVTRMLDGRPAIARFHADTRGRLLAASEDEDGDGTFDWIASYAYEDAANAMSAVATRPSASTERGFVTRGACDAPRMPETALQPPAPMIGGDGRIFITIPGHDILGL